MIIRGFVLLLFVVLILFLVKEYGRSDGSKYEFEGNLLFLLVILL